MASPQDCCTVDTAADVAPASASAEDHLKVNNTTLTKEEQLALLRSVLPACQPQEGSPANTFTHSELDDLQRAVGSIQVGPSRHNDASVDSGASAGTTANANEKNDNKKKVVLDSHHHSTNSNVIDICQLQNAFVPPTSSADVSAPTADRDDDRSNSLDWHGSPRFHPNARVAQAFRETVRSGSFTKPTNGVCPGFLQCNLVVLPQGPVAFDFLLFCQRNPQSCPLIEVIDGSPYAPAVAKGSDLRKDCPKYAIYRDGKLDKEVTDVTDYWPEDSVAFLIGCSFSYDGALLDAGIRLKSAEQGKNVPMYRTSLKCRPAGQLKGNVVVSMKPVSALLVSKHIEITSKYTHAHGGPVAVGSSSAIGIRDIDKPEWGEAIDIAPHEVPIFHACGVTPQSVLMDSKVPFAITHSAGYMFVTDLPSDMGV
mmetsp:Transcript_53430/g.130020  ORF Transcript_53430/g.130020 Transcript_53430/m.130020 type:complete len:425 (-) Transcript_53430:2770-4044(-)